MKRGRVLLTMSLALSACTPSLAPADPINQTLEALERPDGVACPSTLDCTWLPAVFGPVPGRPGEYKYAPARTARLRNICG